MFKKYYLNAVLLVLFIGVMAIFISDEANAHKVQKNGKMVEHPTITCKPPEKRNALEMYFCKIPYVINCI